MNNFWNGFEKQSSYKKYLIGGGIGAGVGTLGGIAPGVGGGLANSEKDERLKGAGKGALGGAATGAILGGLSGIAVTRGASKLTKAFKDGKYKSKVEETIKDFVDSDMVKDTTEKAFKSKFK